MATVSTGKVDLAQSYLDAIMRQREQKQRKRETTLGLFAEGAKGFGDAFQARKGREHEAGLQADRLASAEKIPGLQAAAGIEEATGLQTAADERIMEIYGGTMEEATQRAFEAEARAKAQGDVAYQQWLASPDGKITRDWMLEYQAAGSADLNIDTGDVNERMQKVVASYGEHWFEPDSMNPLDLAALRADFEQEAANDKDPEGMMRAFDRWFGTVEGNQIEPPPEPLAGETPGLGGILNIIQTGWDAQAGKVGKFGERDPDISAEEIPYAQGLLKIINDAKASGGEVHPRVIDALFELGAEGTMRPTQTVNVGWSLERIKRLIEEAGGTIGAGAPAAPVEQPVDAQYQIGTGRVESPAGGVALPPLSRTPPKKESEIERLLREKGR